MKNGCNENEVNAFLNVKTRKDLASALGIKEKILVYNLYVLSDQRDAKCTKVYEHEVAKISISRG